MTLGKALRRSGWGAGLVGLAGLVGAACDGGTTTDDDGCSSCASGGSTGGRAGGLGGANGSGGGALGGAGTGGANGSGGVGTGGANGTGGGGTGGGNGTGGADGVCTSSIAATVRDFKGVGEPGGHPDFEFSARGVFNVDNSLFQGWTDSGCGLVNAALVAGAPEFNATPVTAAGEQVVGIGAQRRVVGSPSTGCYPATSGDCGVGTCTPWTDFKPPSYTIQSASSFNDWYHDSAYNQTLSVQIQLTDDGTATGTRMYDSSAFFPIDLQGWGNTPGKSHNFHFTTEIHLQFTYQAGQVLTFRGDDDLWIFVNGKLALDMGGAHQPLLGTIDFEARAAALGIAPGQKYQMDIFHAERQSDASNFRIRTNISCLVNVPRVK